MNKTVGTALTTILEERLTTQSANLTIGVKNEGGVALNAFNIDFQIVEGGSWWTWFSSPTDFSSIGEDSPILGVIGEPVSLAPGGITSIKFDRLDGWLAIRV